MSVQMTDFVRGEGDPIAGNFRRGDSFRFAAGKHEECEQKITALGPGIRVDYQARTIYQGVLVRCGGCLLSWVITR